MTAEVVRGEKTTAPIPERRSPDPGKRLQNMEKPEKPASGAFPYPVWRCRVCGYLCARDGPPEVCPICKAKKDRFERFA